MLVLACGGASNTPDLPDIEATVEARLELAKASLVAPTAVPLPTYTPMPLPSPEVIVKEVVVEKEVPVEVQVIKEVEVIKRVIVPGPDRVVIVTATPTSHPPPHAGASHPMPTALVLKKVD